MNIVPLYAALLALLFVALSVRTVRLRHKLRIAIGDGKDSTMLRAMRVHSNFAEYVPLCLILLFLVESQGASASILHGLCLCLLAGRLAHAYGVSQANENLRYRIVGMALTFAALLGSSGFVLLRYFVGRGA